MRARPSRPTQILRAAERWTPLDGRALSWLVLLGGVGLLLGLFMHW